MPERSNTGGPEPLNAPAPDTGSFTGQASSATTGPAPRPATTVDAAPGYAACAPTTVTQTTVTEMTMAKALNAGLRAAMTADAKVLLAGEDIGQLGGVFRITEGLLSEFGPRRVLDTPLAESGIVGTAIGLALGGYRPVVEIQFDGFVYPAFDQIVSQAARLHFRTHGQLRVPLVIRIPYGGHIGAIEHHSESPEALFVHTPGLRVVTPSTPHDAYHLIGQAIACDDPVIFLEPKRRYQERGPVDITAPCPPMDRANVITSGTDVTLVGYGPSVPVCRQAANVAARLPQPISVEVIDLRSLSPLADAEVLASVAETGRCVIVHEAVRTGGVGAELAARVAESCFFELEAPPVRVAAYDLPYPPAGVEGDYLPSVDRILAAIEATVTHEEPKCLPM